MMTPKERAAMQQALEALEEYRDTQMIKAPRRAITALREVLAGQAKQEPSCNQHPDAPHGFARNASHNAGRYVCECEGWEPEQEPVAVVEITYGREPECYVTGNIDDFPEGVFKLYAAPVQQAEQEPVSDYFDFGLEEVEDYLRNCCNSPFMADKLSEIRKSISEPFAYAFSKNETWLFSLFEQPDSIPLYSHPVRTKDLTDAELHQIWRDIKSLVGLYSFQEIARAVIAADREKNK